jgi:uncharacterized protein (DUF983 family)
MTHATVTMRDAALRAVQGRCPCCGQGKLFRSYLKQVENCSVCGESFGQIRADDGAPWLTIIVVGHIFLPLAFLLDLNFLPTWALMIGWAAFFAGLSLLLLPRAKGLFIAILWVTRAPGYNPAPATEI